MSARPAVRLFLVLGGVASACLAPLLVLSGLAVPDAAALALLLALLPALSMAQLQLMQEMEIERMPAYVSSAVTLVMVGGGCLALGARRGGPAAVGLTPLPSGALVTWTAGILVVGLLLMFLFRWLAAALGLEEARVLRELLPRSSRERWAFAGLSLTAGFGEEMAYRGFALTVLATMTGPVVAAAVTSLVFGVLHAYQGVLGIVRTGVLGGILAWGFLAAGSLWPAMAAHAALDIVAGIVLAERLMVPEEGVGVPD